ncbi:hypothetical protein ACFPMF_03935 [Larkinella bovis]|uniref:DUF3575 domain-containing protein n=1 Tax=Larkinella bovis TaxID=683041 RepID=A0ABW0I502_9BACT
MKRTLRLAIAFLFITLLPVRVLAQQPKTMAGRADSHPASFAIRLGFTQLYGDLKEQSFSPFGGVTLMVPVTNTISVEIPADFGLLRAQQEEFYHSSAKTRFKQVAAAASVNVLEWFKQDQKRYELRPYAGAGLLFFQAEAFDLITGKLQRQTNNQNSHRSRDGIEARGKPGIKNTHELVWVTGLRGSTALSRRMSVFADVRFNLVRTDKLDATLDNNNQVMQASGPAFTEGNHYRTNNHDKWGYVAGGINFYFGERFKK